MFGIVGVFLSCFLVWVFLLALMLVDVKKGNEIKALVGAHVILLVFMCIFKLGMYWFF